MPDNGVDTFLQAEQEAHQLVAELQRLKSEVESYARAHAALDQVAEGLGSLSVALADTADRASSVIETMRKIGTPELLQGQEAVVSQLTSLREEVEQMEGSVASALGQVVGEAQALKGAIAQLATGEGLDRITRALETHDKAQIQALKNLEGNISGGFSSLEGVGRSLRQAVLGSAAATLVGILILAALLLLGPR